MWWIILIAIVAYVIIKFAIDSNKQADAVVKQGGMRKKYKTLVNHLLSGHPQARIVQETATFLNIGVSNMGGTTSFFITQTFGTVTVEWKINSPLFGKHKLEWTFDEFLDQDKMIEKIENDVGKYTMNLMQNLK